MMRLTISQFNGILRKIWCRETSAFPDEWTEENPALGQCAVTAMAACLYFGGEMITARTKNGGIMHCWNRIKGVEVDFTKSQFQGAKPPMKGKIRNKNKLVEEMVRLLKDLPADSACLGDLKRRLELLLGKLEKEVSLLKAADQNGI